MRARSWARIVRDLAWACAGVGALLVLLQASSWIQHTDQEQAQLARAAGERLEQLHAPIADTDAAVKAISAGLTRPCGVAAKPCGTLADVNRTLATVRGATGQVEEAARHENRNLDAMDAQERQLFADLHGTLTTANGTVKALGDAATAAKPVMDATTETVRHADETEQQISPELERLITASAGTMEHGDAITADVQKVADRYANPPAKRWYAKAWEVTKTAGEFAWDFLR